MKIILKSKRNVIFSLLIICFLVLRGQEKATIFYNQNWEITSSSKAIYYRNSTLNSTHDFFEGKFTDFSIKDNRMIGSGEYLSNQKNGEFIQYFENGKIKQQGNYKNNSPFGRWVYYYGNGQLKMIIDFDEKDFQLIEYRDSTNQVLLEKGTGKWETTVYLYDVKTKLIASFKNGKKHGDWNYIGQDGKTRLNEVYRNSQFESGYGYDQYGKRMFSQPQLNIHYFSEPRYNTIEQMVCENNFDVNSSPISRVKKILNLKNCQNISYLNSSLPADQILFVNEDNHSNVWIGTSNSGLIKIDSVFTFYNKENSAIKNNNVSCIQIDKNDKIWFSYQSCIEHPDIKTAGLACLSDNKIVIYNTDNSGLTSNGINDIAVDKNNKKWFATENCIISYDENLFKWEKHFNKESEIRKVDTMKYKNKNEYLRYAKEINSVTKSWEEKVYQNNNKSYNNQAEATETHYSTMTFYELPINYLSIDILPTDEKLISSSRNGFCIYNEKSWECDTSRSNLQYMRILLTRKFQLTKNDTLVYMNQLSQIVKKNMILQLISGIDNSFWARTNNNIFKITRDRIIEFDLFDKDIKYIQNGNFKTKFYYLYKDKLGGIWACANCAILKIE